MSVIVKGMKMPESCIDCEIKQYDDYEDDCVCPFSGVVCLSIGRQDACPLVALPDHHGRLVDADATIKEIKARNPYDVSYEDAWAITCIEHASTIEPERKTGRWEDVHIDVANDDKGRSYRFYSCTACGVTSIPAMLGMKKKWLHFCPNCGAKMEG